MFDRFTERAKRALSCAVKAAQEFRHDYIGTEHMLLGLVDQPGCTAAQVLTGLAIDLEALRVRVSERVKRGGSEAVEGQLPFTPGAKKALECSMEEAAQLAHGSIGTEHLLLGLVRERKGIAATALADSGVELAKLRAAVLEYLDSARGE